MDESQIQSTEAAGRKTRPWQQPSTRLPVVLGTLTAMAVVAGLWLGIGYVWSAVIAGDADTAGSGQWPFVLQNFGTGVSFGVLVRRQVRILPRTLQRFDLSSVIVVLLGLLALLMGSLGGESGP